MRPRRRRRFSGSGSGLLRGFGFGFGGIVWFGLSSASRSAEAGSGCGSWVAGGLLVVIIVDWYLHGYQPIYWAVGGSLVVGASASSGFRGLFWIKIVAIGIGLGALVLLVGFLMGFESSTFVIVVMMGGASRTSRGLVGTMLLVGTTIGGGVAAFSGCGQLVAVGGSSTGIGLDGSSKSAGSPSRVLSGISLGAMVKLPSWPFLQWLSLAHVEGSSVSSIVLAGLILKQAVVLGVR